MILYFEQWPELVEMVKLQLDSDAVPSGLTNQDLAHLLDTSVSDIENRKKRIQRHALRAKKYVFGPTPPAAKAE